ncbi:MAG: NPCBM/NEW2 domain-containing protein [Planctomycetes bacterium]|nr:NPCBM/NEW2 domain-containing protein [Planctomycetota bacterium]
MIRLSLIVMLIVAGFGVAPSPRPVVRIEPLIGKAFDARVVGVAPDGRVTLDPPGAEPMLLDDIKRIVPLRAQRPTTDELPIRQFFHLVGGERITGQLVASGGARVVRVEAGLPKPLDLPMDRLAAVRFAVPEHAAASHELSARLASPPKDKDVLIVVKEDKPVVVAGAIERISPEGIEFTIGRKTQKVALDAAYAAVFAAPNAPVKPAPCTVRLLTGSEIPGRLSATDDANIRLDAGPLGAIDAPWESVDELRFRSERVVYLSDLRPASSRVHSILDVEFPPRMDRSVTGAPLVMRGRSFDKGIGTHAVCSLAFELNGDFERFTAQGGIDDSANAAGSGAGHGSVILCVVADGRELFKSSVLRGDSAPIPISVDVSGVKSLTLETLDADDLDISDHADWADAMLIKARPQAMR